MRALWSVLWCAGLAKMNMINASRVARTHGNFERFYVKFSDARIETLVVYHGNFFFDGKF